MREAEPLPVDLEDPGLDRVGQPGLCPAAGGRLDEAHGRVGERGNDPRHLEPGSPEAIDALVDELFEVRREIGSSSPGPTLPPRRWSARASSRAKNGFPPEVSQMRRSVGRGKTAPTRVRSSSCSAPTLSGPSSMRWSRSSGTSSRSQGGASPRAVRIAATGSASRRAQSEPEHRQRRCVEPLDVVDREQEPVAGGELPQRAQEGERDHALVGGATLGFRERERRFERPPLRPRQLRQHVGNDASDQVGQPDERERRFRFGRTAGEHQIAALPRRLDGGEPHRRLADPGLADEHGGRGKLSGRLEEIEESGELVLPAGEGEER